jgi:deoxyribodipyrimidine photo-lyase
MRLHWHRRDLRASDNRGLAAAADDGPVLPVFVLDPDVLEHAAPPRVAFLLDALDALGESYRERGSDLLVVRGDPAELFPAIADAHGAESVVYDCDYSGLARERDERVRGALDDREIDHEGHHDAVHHEPGTITTNDGDPYSVFTHFGKKWLDREKADPYPTPEADTLVDADAMADAGGSEAAPTGVDGALPTLDDLGFEEPEGAIPEAGAEAARDRLESFCEGDIYRYDERRDYPAAECTSRLSVDLKYGTIGIREVSARVARAMDDADGEAERESVEAFQLQLAWREFYTHVLYYNPGVVAENFKQYENPIDWRDSADELGAWKAGETGYPIVDAGMRQLRAESYVHNRVRMIVASFLTKDLLADWRAGYDWFREKLVDHDTGNDNGGWQWAASTGTDAQPYFRIFNPMTQGADYDPDAEYIAEYVPELRGVDPEQVHGWHELGSEEREAVAPAYPAPIVEHAERRERALAMFERARGESED